MFLSLFQQMYYCFPLRLVRPRESSGIGQVMSYPFSGKQSAITVCCIHIKDRSTALISVMAGEMTQMSPVWMQLMVEVTHISSSVFYMRSKIFTYFQLHTNLPSAYIRTKLCCTLRLYYKISWLSKYKGHITKSVVQHGVFFLLC